MFSKTNTFAQKLALNSPAIIQAPMAGGITTPQLVAAVSNANGLGSFATGYLTTEQVEQGIREIKKLTKNSFAVNLFIPNEVSQNSSEIINYQRVLNKFRRELGLKETEESSVVFPQDNFRDIVNVLLKENIHMVSFTFGLLPLDVIRVFKKNDIYLMGTATSLEEAKVLVDVGIDAVIAQGYEAGGHQGSFLATQSSLKTLALVAQITQALDCPVIAAGGIMNGQDIVNALSSGASAVQMGTAFLATKESGASKAYKQVLIKTKTSEIDPTTLTNVYSGKMVRGMRTEFVDYVESLGIAIPPYPITNILSNSLRKEAAKQDAVNIMSIWCGQGVRLITEDLTAKELLEKLRGEFRGK